MGYLGSVPVLQSTTFTGINSQSFSPNGSTATFTMNRTVAATKDIEVVVDNVQQSPYDGSYSVNGTILTFSENPPAGTNSIYVIYRDAPIGSITDPLAVKKSGDTMTGALTMLADAGGTVLFTRGRSSDGLAQFGMRNNADTAWTGLLQFPADGSMIWNGGSGLQERFKVDTSGRVSVPYQPAFSVSYDGPGYNAVESNSATWDAVQWNVVTGNGRFNQGNHYNPVTGMFTAPVNGKYLFLVQMHHSAGSGVPSSYCYMDIARGTTATQNEVTGASSWHRNIMYFSNDTWYEMPPAVTILNMNANDSIFIRIVSTGGATFLGSNRPDHNRFSCYFLG